MKLNSWTKYLRPCMGFEDMVSGYLLWISVMSLPFLEFFIVVLANIDILPNNGLCPNYVFRLSLILNLVK